MPGLDEKARLRPASQVGRRFVEDLGQFVGQTLRLKVGWTCRSNVVLSHRAVLEEEEKKARAEAFATLQKGQVLDGKVTRLVTFGAFVDIGKGVEGLLHISDISWSRIKHPSEVLSEGQEIKVVVLNVDTERERISLGYKQLQPDPWDNIAQRFPEGTITKGVVTKLMDFGAFVSIADGVEGLVHISQLSDRRISRPDEVVQVGDEITVKVIGIKPQEHRISLSARQVLEEGERNEYRKYMKDQKADETVTIGDRLGYDLEAGANRTTNKVTSRQNASRYARAQIDTCATLANVRVCPLQLFVWCSWGIGIMLTVFEGKPIYGQASAVCMLLSLQWSRWPWWQWCGFS